DRLLIRNARREPTRHYNLLRQDLLDANNNRIIARTVLNRIKEVGLQCRRPIRRVPLTSGNKRNGLVWCNEKQNWYEEWNSVMYTDESHFCVFSDRRTVRVGRLPNTRVDDPYVQDVHHFRGRSVIFWGGIFFGGCTELYICQNTMNAQIYADDILNDSVEHYRTTLEPNFRF
ncbi:HTH Tnp Tc3 2 and/or DDE 3 domain containing protein, partial [Asbolus verrucosus]